MIRDYIILALKNIKNRGLRSWLTMLGIFIGIAAVVSLISLGDALQQAITGQFATLDADKLVVQNAGTGFGPPGSTVVNKLNEHDLRVLSSVSGVKETIPRLIRIVKVDFNKVSDFSYIASMPDNKVQLEIIYDSLNIELESGRLLEASDRGKVVLGNDFTDDRFGKKVRIGSMLKIQGKEFEVIGILKKASTFQINSVILMAESELMDILNIDDEIDMIIVQVVDKNQIEDVAQRIAVELREDRDLKEGEDDFSVQSPVQSVETINTILGVIRIVITGIASISLLIGGIGIANTMFTSVLERTREIGVMKAIGAKNKDILYIFLFESAFLGLVGGIVGIIIGLSLAFLASGVASSFLGIDFIVSISFPLVLFSLSFSFLIGVLSGIIPAFQASRLNPIEALRK
ncbi:MAG: ABC transporter permease [Nanoarchaeota archaeon]|nr:ABC transporter permease [Nanoarchaeota archaeon]